MDTIFRAETLARPCQEATRQPCEESRLKAHLRRNLYAAIGSELIPAFARTRILRRLGARVADSACVWSGCHFQSMRFCLGEHVFINVGFFFDGAATLRIERDVRIGQFVRVITATHGVGPSTQRCTIEAITAPVTIERGCWIGAGVTLMPGVTVRRGCVIGAGATVLDSTEPDGLYVGTPARRVRTLPG
jgi:maltose O-acetyltransferase